ncbi:DUF4303 domain-containing protein (plasmid) [Ralstonia sp. 25C]|uniref:DUF4303 domain-containing protein n=1 Tax=Ralstonia sp. 25C TaxID=3447363 RepID=UPI003F74F6ED
MSGLSDVVGNFDELCAKIELAASQAFSLVREKYPGRGFCGYALYSDLDAVTVAPSVNSVGHLQKMISDDPDDAVYYRWSPDEWDHEFEGADFFKDISASLRNEVKKMDSEDKREAFRRSVYECCVAALESLKSKGFFSDMNDADVLVFTISDAENALESDWIARLNRPDLAKEFRDWIVSLR